MVARKKIQISSLHACVNNFHPPEAGDATVLYFAGLLHKYLPLNQC